MDKTVKEHFVKIYINLVWENLSYVKYMDNMMEEMQEEYSRHEADDQ